MIEIFEQADVVTISPALAAKANPEFDFETVEQRPLIVAWTDANKRIMRLDGGVVWSKKKMNLVVIGEVGNLPMSVANICTSVPEKATRAKGKYDKKKHDKKKRLTIDVRNLLVDTASIIKCRQWTITDAASTIMFIPAKRVLVSGANQEHLNEKQSLLLEIFLSHADKELSLPQATKLTWGAETTEASMGSTEAYKSGLATKFKILGNTSVQFPKGSQRSSKKGYVITLKEGATLAHN